MTITTMDGRDVDSLELEVRRLLRTVRLVFETGFPDDISERVTRMMHDKDIRKIHAGRVTHPACFVFHLADLAKDRRGREFWSSDQLAHIREAMHADAGELARLSLETFRSLGLETFDDLVANENALRYLTPVTMHSGLPALNIPDLVALIETAVRRHRITALDQVELWKSTPHGFHGLWASPRRLFSRADPIALDLLERINAALSGDESGGLSLPSHIRNALARIDASVHSTIHARGISVPRAWISIDDASCLGPVMNLPPVAEGDISRWRISGAPLAETPSHPSDTIQIPLGPSQSHEVTAVDAVGRVVGARTLRTHGAIPAYFFSAVDGRLLERSGSVVVKDGAKMLVLLHPKAAIEDVPPTSRVFEPRSGEWSEWKLFEFDAADLIHLNITDTANPETDDDTVVFREPDARPSLSAPASHLARVRHESGEVHDAPPSLHMPIGSVDPSLIEVSVECDGANRTAGLTELRRDGDQVDLSTLFEDDGVHKVSVNGPLGLSMPAKKIVLCRGLSIEQDPPLLLPGNEATLHVSSNGFEADMVVSDEHEWVDASIADMVFRFGLIRLQWSVASSSDARRNLGVKQFLLSIDEARRERAMLLHLSSTLPVPMKVELARGHEVLASKWSSTSSGRWTVDLTPFLHMAEEVPEENLSVRVVVGGSPPVEVGRLASKYLVTITSQHIDESGSDTVLQLLIEENRAFSDRVLRVWSVDRPWEPSFRIPVDDRMRGQVTVRLPRDHRIGRHRACLRIEGDDNQDEIMPPPHARGVIDIELTTGRLDDPTIPTDRIVSAVRTGLFDSIQDGDVRDHGYVLVALLARLITDEGPGALTLQRAGVIYRLIESIPSGISRIIALAIERNVIDDSDRLIVSLALLPLVFEAEDKQDLVVDEDSSELVWSRLPWIAAAIEPWSDSLATRLKWTEKLGWPEDAPSQGLDDDDGDDAIDTEDLPPPEPRRILTDQFDQDVRRICGMSTSDVQRYLGHLIGTKDGMPLSRDSEWDSVLLSIAPLYGNESALNTWRRRHEGAISSSHSHVSRHRFKALFRQYTARAVWQSDPQYGWLLLDSVSLAARAVDTRDESIPEMMALIELANYAPRWVSYSVLLALSLRPMD